MTLKHHCCLLFHCSLTTLKGCCHERTVSQTDIRVRIRLFFLSYYDIPRSRYLNHIILIYGNSGRAAKMERAKKRAWKREWKGWRERLSWMTSAAASIVKTGGTNDTNFAISYIVYFRTLSEWKPAFGQGAIRTTADTYSGKNLCRVWVLSLHIQNIIDKALPAAT